MSIDAGAFLRGLTKGMFAAQEMRERREATAERKADLKRDFLLRVSQGLAGIDDPDTFDQALEQFRGLAPQFGADPSEIVWTFPESKRKQIKTQRAEAALTGLIKNNRFFEDGTYTIDGEQISGRELLTMAGVPRGTRRVKEEIDIPPAGEGSLGRFLAPTGTQTIEREEEIPFAAPRRITLGEYDPATFAKHPHLARLPVPLDKDGNLDTVKLLDIYGKVVPNPVDAAKAATERVDKDRADFGRRMGRIQQAMDQADIPEQFRTHVMAFNALVNDFRRHKPWVGVKQLPMDAARAVGEWVKSRAKKPAKPDRRFLSATAALAAAEADKEAILANKPPALDEAGVSNTDAIAAWRRSLDRVESRIRKAKAELKVFGAAGDVDQEDDTADLEEFYK